MSLPVTMSDNVISPGLIILHGNQLEQLRAAVFAWLRQHPLNPLEQETYLVQSNGVAEWLKIAIAEDMGVYAATKIELPGRFLWSVYRNMLGREAIPGSSDLDKAPLTWRLMRLIPELLDQPDFEPLQRFLADGDPERRLQLADRLSGLIDLYQIYRVDWLTDWAQGHDQLRKAQGELQPLADDQVWQAALWRAILNDIPKEGRGLGRVNVHQRFVTAILQGAVPVAPLPRRVILFGISALPRQTLEALSALAEHTQVVLAVPNPCQYYWGDIMDGSQLFKAQNKRHQFREGRDLSAIAPEDLHAHCHPLLANWGRQGRDFIRMLDDFDNAQQTHARFSGLRIDLFSEGEGTTLLERVQVAIRDLLPPEEHPCVAFDPDDKSIEFHIAHSVQREVDVLHDQLLAMFAASVADSSALFSSSVSGSALASLRPKDIVVMVPDIDVFSPAIRSVFGQYSRSDPRFIPYEIGDAKERTSNPVLVAVDWLLRLPQQRCQQSEVRDLLAVPALAVRFGLSEDDLPQLCQWIEGAGIRWGLDQQHRSGIDLGPAGEQNSWIFGVRRMLLGYACGDDVAYAGIESYAEIAGLNAALAGSLAQFVGALINWRTVLAQPASPVAWGVRARIFLAEFFNAEDENDRLTLGRLDEALQSWLLACAHAGFTEQVPLAVVREAWLGALDESTLNHRFVSGGVTFCTLMPMRAIPFRVVCLLGLNEGDFPRRTRSVDFDLLAQPGMARPGDRSRRDDDRYLMLEALLSARDKLYISWAGRDVRDNSEQPCSLLVAQLRDYLENAWHCPADQLTTLHPLQPFSRHYFEQGGLLTYAREWRAAHAGTEQQPDTLPSMEPEAGFCLKIIELARFIRQPVNVFFRKRLGVYFTDDQVMGDDDEPFGVNALEEYHLADSLLDDAGEPEFPQQVSARLRQRAARLSREGKLPIGLMGERWQHRLVAELTPIRTEWLHLRNSYPVPADKLGVSIEHHGIHLDDWLDHLYTDGRSEGKCIWMTQIASKVTSATSADDIKPRGDKLIEGWLRQLIAAASGQTVTGYLVARDALITMEPLEQEKSAGILAGLLAYWRKGMDQPLPTACKTALAFLQKDNPAQAYNGAYLRNGEVDDLCLARLWPDFAALSAEPEWVSCSSGLYGPFCDWLASHIHIQLISSVDDVQADAQADAQVNNSEEQLP